MSFVEGPTSQAAQPSAPRTAEVVPGSPSPATQTSQAKRQAVREAALLSILALVAIIGVGIIAMLIIQRHRRSYVASIQRGKRLKPKTRADAWVEAAKRLEAKDRSDDDTVDIDPDDLGSNDLGPDDLDPPKPNR